VSHKKSLSELYNGVTGIVQNTGDFTMDPDSKWFEDLNNRRQMYRTNPNSFAYYSPETDTPQFPIVNRQGRPDISMMLRSLGIALFLQSKNPSIAGLDDIIHKIESVISTYRDDVPEYRVNLVRTKDVTQTLNNLVYGPYEPNQQLAMMVSALSGDNKNMDLRANTNSPTNSLQKEEPVEKSVNQPKADRTNMVQGPTQFPTKTEQDLDILLKDLATKVAQLKAQKLNLDDSKIKKT